MSKLTDLLAQIELRLADLWKDYEQSHDTSVLRAIQALQDERSAALDRYR